MNSPYKNRRPALPKNRLITGRKPLLEALNNAVDIEKIFILKSASGEEISDIKKIAQKFDIPLSFVPIEKLNRFSNTNHQGVVAIAGLITYQPLEEIINQVMDNGDTPLIVILDGITDTRNLGAIARSALCYGAHALVLPVKNSAAITEEAVKTSAGALETLPICRMPTVEDAIKTVRMCGLQVLATSLTSEQLISSLELTVPLAIVIGSEDKGISKETIKYADHLAKIPMVGNFDSLNVSVASGIILYEVFRQNISK